MLRWSEFPLPGTLVNQHISVQKGFFDVKTTSLATDDHCFTSQPILFDGRHTLVHKRRVFESSGRAQNFQKPSTHGDSTQIFRLLIA